jgi:hypothetical protein
MPEKIITIKGVACPFDMLSILNETKMHNRRLAVLRQAGHEVMNVGEAWKGFYRHSLQQAFQNSPDAQIVITNIHGNIRDDKHYMAARHKASTTLWAEDFYRDLAIFSGNKPLDIFMFSCGSGNGLHAATEYLPVGSTVVSVTRTDAISSYIPDIKFLEGIKTSKTSASEGLFFNLLSCGYENEQYYPNLSISTQQKEKYDPSWDMWDIARLAMYGDELLAPAFEEKAKEYLADFFDKDILLKALETIRLYSRAINNPPAKDTSEKTPVKISYNIDEYSYEMDARRQGLFGAMCALGYCAAREEIGAFKASALRNNVTPFCPEFAPIISLPETAML